MGIIRQNQAWYADLIQNGIEAAALFVDLLNTVNYNGSKKPSETGSKEMRLLKSIAGVVGYFVVYVIVFFVVVGVDLVLNFPANGSEAVQSTKALTEAVSERNEVNYERIMIIGNAACLVVYGLIIKISKKSIRERLDLRPFSIKKAAILLVLGILLNILITYALSLLPIPESAMSEYSESVGRLDYLSFIGVFNAIIMAPIFEEVLLRGLIMKTLLRGMPVALALVIQALIFGFLHGQIVWMVYTAAMGILLGLVRLRSGSLFACILLHFSLNASNYILDPLYAWVGDNYALAYGLLGFSLAAAFLLIKGVLKKEPVLAADPLSHMADTA